MRQDRFGADMGAAACSLYSGTFLGQLANGFLPSKESGVIIVGLIFAGGFSFVWLVCIALCNQKLVFMPDKINNHWVGFAIGAPFLYLSCAVSWGLITGELYR